MDFEEYLLLGASPESLLQTSGNRVLTNPIAGTYPRGSDSDDDKRLETALLADPKELAEHEMLIERCKQDLAKVCKSASIQVPRHLYIEKYEHVMHIVSDVTATLRDDSSSIDALLACLPAGTVSGAPKTKAMRIISELENNKRGVYGGGVGYINFNHDINFALAIRMLTIKGETAYLQAGAGIVAQSVPEKEYEETMHKAKSLISAGGGTAVPKKGYNLPIERKQNMKSCLEKLLANQDMAQHEMNEAISNIFAGSVSDSQIAAFMIALGKKGETPEEIAGMAEAIREHASQPNILSSNMMDNCGTGGDQSQSFNISTAAAFVLAGSGVKVAKHGNRSISSKTGSADVLEELGVPLDLAAGQTEEILEKNNIAFLYAPHVHQKLGQITRVRKELGIPTIFNLMGPLTNPMHLSTQLMGIYRRDMLEMMAETLQKLGRKRAIVINGAGHMDEASLAGTNHLCLLENGKVHSFTLHPHEVGLPVYENEQIKGGSARQNARILLDVLHGNPGPCLDTVVFNAGIALFANGKATSFKEGIQLAKDSIASGAAMEKLQFLIDCKNRYQSIS
ncbi:anthranilate phosphoribosyltransferase [Virgibacillus halophilus]|uniref:Anthranilate phosphoribosyltransferase n=1 Tax=Tigheibacillus halophilus TaxID=361280 RepID=A0ABU5C8A0_9BACI|nr:anthranilate phosphoribosyltransferase [Virgibacillus halophilus]